MRVRILGFALLPGLTLTLRSCKTSQSSHGSSDPSEPGLLQANLSMYRMASG